MQRIYYLIALFTIFIIVGCEGEERWTRGPVEIYFCEKNDTTLTAAQHDFTVSMASSNSIAPTDVWQFFTLQVWDNNKPDSLWYDHAEWDYYTEVDLEKTSTSISYDWIRFEKLKDTDTPKFRVIVQENTSDKPRTLRVMFGEEHKDRGATVGYFVVSQKARPDMEPFEMKIRFKGKEK